MISSRKWMHKYIPVLFVLAILLLPTSPAHASATIKNLTKGVSSLGLLAYWPFDGTNTTISNVGHDGTATDMSGSGHSATLGGGDWWEETSRVTGKMGQALYFNGGNVVDAGDFADNLGEMTVSAWFKTTDTTTSWNPLVTKISDIATGAGWSLAVGPGIDGTVDFVVQQSGGVHYNENYTGTVVNDGKWHHAVATLTGGINGTIAIYVDGVAQSTTHAGDNAITTATTTEIVRVGARGDTFFEGSIDEPRIYNRALGATEVLKLYEASSAKVNRTPKTVVSNLGLVGYWPFDGIYNTWSSDTAGTTTDVSGSGNTGTFTNMNIATAPAFGKLGQALKFDGTGDFVDTGTNTITGTHAFTLSAWINTNLVNRYSGAVSIGTSAADESAYIGTCGSSGGITGTPSSIGGGFYGNNFCSGVTTLNKWIHVAMTFAGGAAGSVRIYVDGVDQVGGTATPNIGATNRKIGRIGSDTIYDFDGKVDEARIYSRALTANEILALYNLGTPVKINKTETKSVPSGLVGYWPFDGSYTVWTDATTATAIDATGGGHTGTLTTMNQATSPALGKKGQALYFDGSNDSVDIADSSVLDLSSSGAYTWSFWVKPAAFGDLKDSFATYDGGGVNFLSISTHTTSDANYGPCTKCVTVAWANTGGVNYQMTHTSDNALVTNKWTHVLITYDGSLSQSTRFKIYADGTDVTNTGDVYSNNTISAISPTTTQIGGEPGAHVNGSIDEFRFYNRKLTAAEIAELAKP